MLRAVERLSAGDADDAACAAALVARHAEVTRALSERVVDVPAYAEGLIEQARREGWNDPGLAAATVGTSRLVDPEPSSLGRPAGGSRRSPGGLRARHGLAGDGAMGRQRTRARQPCQHGRPHSVRLPRRNLSPRPHRPCSRNAPRRIRRGHPEESPSSLRLPGPSGYRTGCRWCPNRPAGLRQPDTRPPEPGPRRRRGFDQFARLTAPGSWPPPQRTGNHGSTRQ